MDRYFESCEEFYARQEEAARWAEEFYAREDAKVIEDLLRLARWAEEIDEEEEDGSDAYDPERGGGFI